MVLAEFKCNMCNVRFQIEVLEPDDRREPYNVQPVRCPRCRSPEVARLGNARKAQVRVR